MRGVLHFLARSLDKIGKQVTSSIFNWIYRVHKGIEIVAASIKVGGQQICSEHVQVLWEGEVIAEVGIGECGRR